MKNKYLIIASILMILVGFLRGFGGLLLILHGNNVNAGNAISASQTQSHLLGIGLIIVFILFITSAYLLLRQKIKIGWILSWIAIVVFLLGGVINGIVLFGAPKIQGQIFNLTASILIAFNLIQSKLKKTK